MQVKVFTEYTGRYYEIIKELPDEASAPNRSILRELPDKERSRVMGLMRAYFDPCLEEYLLYSKRLVDKDVWRVWERGIIFTVKLPTFRDAWREIKIEGYNNEFVKYVDEILSS